MCAVPNAAPFVANLLNVFLLLFPKLFFKTFVTMPVISVVTGYYHNFLFHFRCKFLPSFFLRPFASHSSPLLFAYPSLCMFWLLIIYFLLALTFLIYAA